MGVRAPFFSNRITVEILTEHRPATCLRLRSLGGLVYIGLLVVSLGLFDEVPFVAQ